MEDSKVCYREVEFFLAVQEEVGIYFALLNDKDFSNFIVRAGVKEPLISLIPGRKCLWAVCLLIRFQLYILVP